MSVIDTALAGCLDVVFDTGGTSVTYTPSGGSGVTIQAMLSPVSEQRIDGDDRQRTFRRMTIEIRRDSKGVAEPAIGDQITVGDGVFAVETIVSMTALTARLALMCLDTRMIRDGGGVLRPPR
jgi:hypothetical protein